MKIWNEKRIRTIKGELNLLDTNPFLWKGMFPIKK
jgi:hypothetical protein